MGLQVTSRTFTDDQGRTLSFPYFNGYDKTTAKYKIQVEFRIDLSTTISVVKTGNLLELTSGNWEDFGFVAGQTISGNLGGYSFTGVLIGFIDGVTMQVDGFTPAITDDVFSSGSITSNGVPDAIDFYFNLVPNQNGGGNEFSFIDGEVNKFRAFVGGMSVTDIVGFTRLSLFSGGSIMTGEIERLADVGTKKQYEISFTFKVWTVKLPEMYLTNACPKPWIQFDIFPQFNNAGVKLSAVNTPNDANVGLTDENGNGAIPAYDLAYCNFENLSANTLPSIDYSQTTAFEVRINGDFTATSKFNLAMWVDQQTESFYKNLQSTFDANSLMLTNETALSVGTSGTITSATRSDLASIELQDLDITNNTDHVIITGKLVPNSEYTDLIASYDTFDRNYKFWIRCEDSTLSSNLVNPVWVVASENVFSKEEIPLGSYPTESIEFFRHDGNSISDIIKEDDIRGIVKLKFPKNEQFLSLNIVTGARNIITSELFYLEEFNLNLLQFPILTDGTCPIDSTVNRNFRLAPTNPNNFVKVYRDPSLDDVDSYGVVIDYSLLIRWEYWIQQQNTNIAFYGNSTKDWINYQITDWVVASGFTILTNNGLYRNTIGVIPIQGYDVTWSGSSSIEYFKEDGTPLTAPLIDEVCRIKITHTNTIPFIPINYNYAQMTVEPFEGSPRWSISSVYPQGNVNANPLRPLTGEVGVKITFSGNDMITECLFDPTKLNSPQKVSFTGRFLAVVEGEVEARSKFDAVLKKLPKDTTPEDRGVDSCCCKFEVLADLYSNDSHKNDINSFDGIGDDIEFVLLKGDGTEAMFQPTTQNMPNDVNAKMCVIPWKEVLIADGNGCYKVVRNTTTAGLEFTDILGEFELNQFTWDRADRTVRMRSIMNDSNQSKGINYTNSNFVTDIRFTADLEEFQPNTKIENLKSSNYEMSKVKRENFTRWTLNVEPNSFCIIDQLINFHLVGENTCYLSDYNSTAYNKRLLDVPMILSQAGGGATMQAYRGSMKQGFKAEFEQKVQQDWTKYGFIGDSGEVNPSLPFLPNTSNAPNPITVDVEFNGVVQSSILIDGFENNVINIIL